MSDLRRVLVTCVPAAGLLFGVGMWKLATLPDPPRISVRIDDPVGRARELYQRAQKLERTDPPMAIALCDEAIATIDSFRGTLSDPEPGRNYEFEQLYANVVRLKQICR